LTMALAGHGQLDRCDLSDGPPVHGGKLLLFNYPPLAAVAS
jgi:hypothetical protein